MIGFTKTTEVDVDKYEEHLGAKRVIYFNKSKAEPIIANLRSNQYTNSKLAIRTMQADSSYKYLGLDRQVIRNYLVEFCACPSYIFNKKGEGLTLDAGRVLKPLLAQGKAQEFLTAYIRYKSLVSKLGSIENMLYRTKNPIENDNGDTIVEMGFNFEQRTNLRYYYNNEDIIGLPKEFNECVTVPEGYILAWGDFEQSDFRIAYNLFIRNDENAKIMDACSDKYEGIARIVAKAFNEDFDLTKFKQQRNIMKENILATFYGARSGKTPESDAFIKRFAKYLDTCPRYKEFYARLERRYNLGLPIQVESYFGHMESCSVQQDKVDAINYALNSPIQSCSSEIVILTVNKILEKFYSLGYTKEDIRLYYTRHDEPLFIMKTNVLKDSWVFEDCSEIHVDNWTPLRLSFKFGHSYTKKDETIQKMFENYIKIDSNKLTKIEPTPAPEPYMPISDTKILAVDYSKIENDNKTIIAFYDINDNKVDYILADTLDDAEIFNIIQSKLLESSKDLYDLNCTGCLVYNKGVKKDFFENRVYFKLNQEKQLEITKAFLLAEYMAYRYCDKYNIERTVSEHLAPNAKFIKSVTALNLIK